MTRTKAALVLILASTGGGLVSCGAPASELPPAKQALETFASEFRSNASKADKSSDPGRPLVDQTDPPPATGLLGQVNAPISGSVFTPTNAWAGWVDTNTYVQVYAGDSPGQSGRGLMFVVRRAGSDGHLDSESSPSTQFVSPPEPGGPLEIVRVEGSELIVSNPQGHEFRFDPASAVFNESGS
jgi:hypothetical protein